jgi:hypothetical protein
MFYRAQLSLMLSLVIGTATFAADPPAKTDSSWDKLLDQTWSNETTQSLLARIESVIPQSHPHQELIDRAIAHRVDSIVEHCETRHTDAYRRAYAHIAMLALELNLDSLNGRDFTNLPADDVRQEFFRRLLKEIETIVDREFHFLTVPQRQHIQLVVSSRIEKIRDDPLKYGYGISCTEDNEEVLITSFESSLGDLARKSDTKPPNFHVAFTTASKAVRAITRRFVELEPKVATLPVILDPFARSRAQGKVEFDEERSMFLVERIPLLRAANKEFAESQKAEREASGAVTEAKFAESRRQLERTRRELQGEGSQVKK